jgi:protein-tyrosine kinase
MAKFRASAVDIEDVCQVPPASSISDIHDRSIGSILAEARGLSAIDVERVLAYQREKGVRFGEAAIALGVVTTDDVLLALAKQFHYPFAPEERRSLHPELVSLNHPFSTQAESFRAIRTQVISRVWSDNISPRRALAVISPNTGDGKTFFAANMAIALAQLGRRTLLVDADMRGPRQNQVFGVGNDVGLSGILSGRGSSQVVQQLQGVASLFILPVGVTPPNPLDLLERPAFALLMREFIAKFDHVLVDTPAAQYGADASVIAARCGAALVVARRDSSRIGELQDLVATIANGSAKVAGVILNDY